MESWNDRIRVYHAGGRVTLRHLEPPSAARSTRSVVSARMISFLIALSDWMILTLFTSESRNNRILRVLLIERLRHGAKRMVDQGAAGSNYNRVVACDQAGQRPGVEIQKFLVQSIIICAANRGLYGHWLKRELECSIEISAVPAERHAAEPCFDVQTRPRKTSFPRHSITMSKFGTLVMVNTLVFIFNVQHTDRAQGPAGLYSYCSYTPVIY